MLTGLIQQLPEFALQGSQIKPQFGPLALVQLAQQPSPVLLQLIQ